METSNAGTKASWVRLTVRSASLVLVVFVTAAAVHTAIWAGPIFVYLLRRPSMRPACAAVRPGMAPAEVQKLFHGANPSDEAMVGARLYFDGKDHCEVQLDPTTQKVLSAQFREEAIGGLE